MGEKIKEDQNLARKTKKFAAMWDSHQFTSSKPCTVSVVPSDSDDETLSASPQPLVLNENISDNIASACSDLPDPPLLEIPDPPPLPSVDVLVESTPLPPPLGWEDPDPVDSVCSGVDSVESTSTSPPTLDLMPHLEPPSEFTVEEMMADSPLVLSPIVSNETLSPRPLHGETPNIEQLEGKTSITPVSHFLDDQGQHVYEFQIPRHVATTVPDYSAPQVLDLDNHSPIPSSSDQNSSENDSDLPRANNPQHAESKIKTYT